MFLRPSEAAALAGLSMRAIYRAVQRGELGAMRLCSRLRIPRRSFEEWIERGTVRSAPPKAIESRVPTRAPHARGSFRRLLEGEVDL